MTTTGIRALFASALVAAFGLVGTNSAPMPSLSGVPAVARVLEAEREVEPSLWSLTRHRACLVTHAANRSEQPNGDRRIDCDRELVASR